MLLFGFAIAPSLGCLLNIPSHLTSDFVVIMRLQTTLLALNFCVRIFSHLLYAHQRMDIINYGQILMLATGFVALWLCFVLRQGVFSLVWASFFSTVVATLLLFLACLRLRLIPFNFFSSKASKTHFVNLLSYC